MRFLDVLTMAIGLLAREKQLSYRFLRREFELDDAGLEDLRFELIIVHRLALDRNGEFLVWAGAPAAHEAPSTLAALAPTVPSSSPEVSQASAALPVIATPEILPSAAEPHGSDAERRQLTVMFCDLAGSTELSTRLDPEDLQDVIRAYQSLCARTIGRFDGYVAKYMGDGILVYFGYPQALERDAERALRAALAVVDAMPALNEEVGQHRTIELAVRIGIATGVVVVGETLGEGAAAEKTVIGETPNVAARLQGLAPPNGIVIGSVTKDLAGDAFVYQDLGARKLRGITGLVKAWGVLGLSVEPEEEDTEGRADVDGGRPPLVGRDEEVGLLRRAWQQTKDERRGRVVLMVGEPGIGKTSLVEVLRADARKEGLPRIAFRCSPYHTNSALYPVIEHIRRLVRWAPDDGPASRLSKLEQMVTDYSLSLEEIVPLFASLLSLPLPEERYQPLALSPQQLRQQTQDELVAWTLEEAERQPMMEVWEDLHWADPSTLELLGLLVDQCPTAPLLLVLTFRPEFAPPWPTRSHMTPITLSRLERPHIEALVTRLAGGKALPAQVLEHVVSKTDGVPLFVEELTKAVLGSDILRENADRYALTGPLSGLTIPATLHESLMARLDRLPKVRELAQLGAVLGREFAYEMLQALAEVEEPTLQDSLGQLVHAELLYQRGRPPRARYVFKHALVQDAAYQSLLKRTRQQYHLQVAQLLETRFPETAETHPEIIAHHYTEAGSPEPAVRYWHQAGRDAIQRSAHREAIGHLALGLEVLATLPDSEARQKRELDLRLALGPSLISTKGYAASEVEANYTRAHELTERPGEVIRRFPVLRGLGLCHLVRGHAKAALRIDQELLSLAQSVDDRGARLFGHYSLGNCLLFLGEPGPAHRHLREVMDHYDADAHRSLALTYNLDVGVGAQGFDALCLWLLGYPDQALARARDALRLAEQQAHPYSLVFAWVWNGLLYQLRRDAEAAATHAQMGAELGKEHGFPLFVAWSALPQGWALAAQSRHAEGVERLQQGLSDGMATGSELFRPCYRALAAEALGAAGSTAAGLQVLDEELGLADRDERFYDAELHRLRGELLWSSAPGDGQAERCFLEALGVAREQQAKSLELRAATSLARLWRRQGKPNEARELLAPVYEWFTEGFDTPDLQDAKALIDELRADPPMADLERSVG